MSTKTLVLALSSFSFALAVTGCATRPQADIDAANAAVGSALAAQAGEYTPESLKAAQDAQAQLDAELTAQEGKVGLFRSYEEATKLAAATKAAGEKAEQEAVKAKETARGEAATLMADARAAIQEAETLLEKAPRGKGTQADINALKSDLAGAKTTLGEAEGASASEHYRDARTKAEAAKGTAASVKSSIERALEARRPARRG